MSCLLSWGHKWDQTATLRIYPDAGHGGIFQYHEQFVREALEFLGS
jgi:hypothetical protein